MGRVEMLHQTEGAQCVRMKRVRDGCELGVLASYMSAGAWRTGKLHVSWSLTYWQVTCQLELGVLASYMSAGVWRTGKLHVSWT